MQDLWDAVHEDPDDDARLLVLADALTAAGDVQGRFIAHQVALSNLDPLDPEGGQPVRVLGFAVPSPAAHLGAPRAHDTPSTRRACSFSANRSVMPAT